MKQLTKEEAIAFGKKGDYKTWTSEQIAAFQLQQDKLCMDFGFFHENVEKVLKRPVWTHEFAHPEHLLMELAKIRVAPTLEEIMGQIPKEKLVVVVAPSDHKEKMGEQ